MGKRYFKRFIYAYALAWLSVTIFLLNSCQKDIALVHPSTAFTADIRTQKLDTDKYLHDNFITHKDRFLHQNLDVMLAKFNLTVKSYSIAKMGHTPGSSLFGYLIIRFEDMKTITNETHKNATSTPMLNVYFEDDISYNAAMSLYIKSFGDWAQAEKDYYGKLLIKDIVLVNPAKQVINHPKAEALSPTGKVIRM